MHRFYFFGKCLYLLFLFIISIVVFHRIDTATFSDKGFLFISIILFLLYLLDGLCVRGLYQVLFLGEGDNSDHYQNVEGEEEDVGDVLRVND